MTSPEPTVRCLRDGGQHQAPRHAGWDTGWRTLPFLVAETPTGGSWRLDTDAGRREVGDGSVLVLAPGTRHRLRALAAASVAMSSSWAYLHWEIDGVPLRLAPGVQVFTDAALVATVQRLGLPLHAERRAAIERQRDGLDLLLALHDASMPMAPADPAVALAMAHAQQHLGRAVGRAELARIAGLSPSRLHDRFVRVTGMAPLAYVQHLRLQRATALLAGTDLAVGEVATRCGFTSLYYFSRCFRAHIGCPPTVFRARQR
jgi:AraC-like DNA-binding protein